jgi:hypothetical protein
MKVPEPHNSFFFALSKTFAVLTTERSRNLLIAGNAGKQMGFCAGKNPAKKFQREKMM